MQDLWLHKLKLHTQFKKICLGNLWAKNWFKIQVPFRRTFSTLRMFGDILRVENEEIKRTAIEALQSLKTNQKTKGERCPFLSLYVYYSLVNWKIILLFSFSRWSLLKIPCLWSEFMYLNWNEKLKFEQNTVLLLYSPFLLVLEVKILWLNVSFKRMQ